MNYLFDTHVLLWSLFAPEKLSRHSVSVITDPESNISISTISLWEISLKYSLDRLELPGDISPEKIVDKVQEAGGIILPLGPEIAASYHRLPRAHTDPFDRMLVWQAIQSNYTLISKDREMKKYRSHGLSLLW